RADLMFRDPDRLQRLLVNPWRPVQIVFSGKSHPGDEPGKQVLQRVYAHTREARFEGRIAFLEDYDMHLAHSLVQGVDLWLNVPRGGVETMKRGLRAAGARFTAQRMVREYVTEYYLPAMRGEPPADDPPTA